MDKCISVEYFIVSHRLCDNNSVINIHVADKLLTNKILRYYPHSPHTSHTFHTFIFHRKIHVYIPCISGNFLSKTTLLYTSRKILFVESFLRGQTVFLPPTFFLFIHKFCVKCGLLSTGFPSAFRASLL